MNRKILLSFDVEEFDMPLEYGYPVSKEKQLEIGKKGLDALGDIWTDKNIKTTLFTTAHFADHFREDIRALSERHEIASHTYFHSAFKTEDLRLSKIKLEEITGIPVYGLRMPRMKKTEIMDVVNAGYTYDSSLNPTWIPGRYNMLHISRTLFKEQGITRIPASVSPSLRIPLFWLSFKNFPYLFYKKILLNTLYKDGYVCLYFHPWEFVDVNGYHLPAYTIKGCKDKLIKKLFQLTEMLKNEGEFCTINEYVSSYERNVTDRVID